MSLPSGGSLVIEPTEALVSIDVNSGKSSGEKGVEDTAFKTNLEAAAEVARQLRCATWVALVVIDFIDMRDNKHNKEVERTLKDALKCDKARVNLGRISQFGMMEMSRQRIAKNINDAITWSARIARAAVELSQSRRWRCRSCVRCMQQRLRDR